jgi:hypothetical protein
MKCVLRFFDYYEFGVSQLSRKFGPLLIYRVAISFLIALSLALQLGCASSGQSIVSRSEQDLFVSVSGTGRDKKEDLADALLKSTMTASGTLVLYQFELEGLVVTKDLYIESTSGFISEYEILKIEPQNDGVTVHINALVSSSRLMQLIKKSDSGKLEVDGELLSQNFEIERKRSEAHLGLLDHLADSYPSSAFLIQLDQVGYQITSDDEAGLELVYTIDWSSTFREALTDFLQTAAREKCFAFHSDRAPGYYKCYGDVGVYDDQIFGLTYRTYSFSDDRLNLKLKDVFGVSDLSVHVYVKSATNQILFDSCFDIPLSGLVASSNWPSVTFFSHSSEGEFFFELTKESSQLLGKIDSIGYKPVQTCRGTS